METSIETHDLGLGFFANLERCNGKLVGLTLRNPSIGLRATLTETETERLIEIMKATEIYA